MKIGFIRQRYAASGGAERYLDAVTRAVATRGYAVHLFANAWNADPSTGTRSGDHRNGG